MSRIPLLRETERCITKVISKIDGTRAVDRIAVTFMMLTLGVLAYATALHMGFVNLDDPSYVMDNSAIQEGLSLESIRFGLASVANNYWHPFTWVSHALDCELYGMNAAGHHCTSVLLHCANLTALMLLLVRVTDRYWPAIFAALSWGMHPLRVESVAWIAERKDVLSGCFGLLTLLTYASYSRQGGLRRYWTVLACFALALMSKPTVVVIPVAMLLMDWWPLQRNVTWVQLIAEKVPFFAMSAAVGAITIYGQHEAGAMSFTAHVPFSLKLENALVSVGIYIGQTFWPVNLACHYPFPTTIDPIAMIASTALLMIVSAVAWALRREWPYVLFGWAWFLLWLLPTIGIIQVGRQGHADRFTYWPAMGLTLAVVWACAEFVERWPRLLRPVVATAAALVTVLSVATYKQTGTWQNSVVLFERALSAGGDNDFIRGALATTLVTEGRDKEAEAHLIAAVRLAPNQYEHHLNLANVRLRLGNLNGAALEAAESIRLTPSHAAAGHSLRAAVLLRAHNYSDAIQEARTAVALGSDATQAAILLNDSGASLAERRELQSAERLLSAACDLQPSLLQAQKNLALVLNDEGRAIEARERIAKALEIAPRSPELRDVAAHLGSM